MKFTAFLLTLIFTACSWAKKHPAPETVNYVDINSYQGQWYEIAKYPNRFQKQCLATKVEYTLLEDGVVKVFNQCKTKKGIDSITGKAYVVDKATNAKLKVVFFPLFGNLLAGKYWILDLDEKYQYALVGDPNRKFLWILSRTPTLDEKIIEDLKLTAEKEGFEVKKLVTSPSWE